MRKIKTRNIKEFLKRNSARRKQSDGIREVFIVGDIIIKLNDKLLLQSSTELRKWKLIRPQDRKYFVAPIGGKIARNGWIALPYVKFRRGRRAKWTHELIKRLALKYNIKDFKSMEKEDGELLSCNWGILDDGTPVIFDWGY